jgi:hypothetical protein
MIKVEGLKEFGRDLKKIDSDLPKMIRLALNESADLVVARVKPQFPHKTGRAAKTIKAASTKSAVRVAMGSKRVPYPAWLDFGGSVGRNQSVKRAYKKDGRFMYPTYRKLRDSGEFEKVMTEALADVARQAGVDVD